MAVQTATTSTTTAVLLGRVGLGGTVLSGVTAAVPLGYTLFAALTGSVTISTTNDVTSLFTRGIILTGAAAGLGVLGLALHVPGLLGAPRRGLATSGVSTALVLITALFLFVGVLPRASAMQHLNDKVVPFALNMRDNCKAPLDAVTAVLTKARDDAKANLTNDAAFAKAMQADADALNTDAQRLFTSQDALRAAAVPDSKYQQLKDDCIAAVSGESGFLLDSNNASAISLPAPFNIKVSAVQLLQDGALVAAGGIPSITLPPGSVEPLMVIALSNIVDQLGTSPAAKKLTAEGDELTKDIKDTLNSNLTPFKNGVPVQ
jgi:hypothetical protein